jgi:aminopeptidase-like protein
MLSSKELQALLERLFPIHRSLTGPGNVKTLEILKEFIPGLQIRSVRSGESAFDWQIPPEWRVYDAYIENMEGKRIVDYSDNNLHVVQYSQSYEGKITRQELMSHIHTNVDLPNAIPYVTSYYDDYWGFCVSENFKKTLRDPEYVVVLRAEKFVGNMHFGELLLPGKSKEEILISTYICHPSMANNELSGPLVATSIAQHIIANEEEQLYSYRFLFLPETIGSIFYLSRNLRKLKKRVKAGFVLTCMGDNQNWSFLGSRYGNTLADKVSIAILEDRGIKFDSYSFLDRGSDERQYCSPGVDLPVVSIMRSKYGTYKEYHTSDDNLNFVSGESLFESAELMLEAISILEKNVTPHASLLCEPFYSKRLIREQSRENRKLTTYNKMVSDFLAYSDGTNDLIDISRIIGTTFDETHRIYCEMLQAGLVTTRV